VAGWRKKRGVLLDALVAAGFLESQPDGVLLVHGWEERNGARIREWLRCNDKRKPRKNPAGFSEGSPEQPRHLDRDLEEEERSTPPRCARWGVGHPAFEVIQHWTSSVWPSLSTVPCPDVTTTQAQSLAVLSGKHGARVLCDAMDAAAADPYWSKTLDLGTFIAKHAKWLGRKAPPRKMTGDLGADHRRQWWRDLTPAESAAFVAERLSLDPSLDASFPFWATGTADEPGMQALIERWERRVRETG
jgi:hypothetical protein